VGDTDRSTFVIDLRDETSRPARQAGASLQDLKRRIDQGAASLRAMIAAQARLRGTSSASGNAARDLRARIAAQRDELARAQRQWIEMGGAFSDAAKKGSELDSVWSAVRGAGGPVGSLASRVAALGSPLTALVGIVSAGIGVFLAFAAAVVHAVIALGRLALASSDARRSELLHLQGITTLRNAWGVAAGTGEELQRAIDRVSDSSALARGEIASMAESLYRSGLRGRNLSDALDGLSIAQSVQGDRGAARFRALAVSIARTGGSVRRLADDYRARLGGIAHRQALSLDRQMQRLHESIGRLFGDVRIEGFLEALNEVVSLFSQSTETGRALHTIVGAIFGPLFDQIGSGSPLVRRFFQGMVIEVQRIVIGVLRVRNAIAHAFGGSALAPMIGGAGALSMGRMAALGLAVALAAVIVPLALFGVLLYTAAVRLSAFAESFIAFTDQVSSWAASGAALVDGFVGGILGGATRVRDAVTGIAGRATSALRDALGIHSPSRVFAMLGRQIPRGFAMGVDGGAEDVSSSTERMASSATGGASEVNARGRGASVQVTIESITINGASTQAAQQAADAFVDQLARALEGVGFEVGAQ
jgi:hypothetical protein